MHLLGASIILFVLLIVSVSAGINLLIPLVIGIFLFGYLAFRKGFSLIEICKMMISGTKGILLIVEILVLIGAITSAWMASGTISVIGYYGLKWMNPRIFILSAFLMSSLMSFLLGTAFGTAGTIGVVILVMAKSAGVTPYIAGGAVIAGAYFGDRCSPMSSSANFISVLTHTDLYINVKNMLKSAVLPFIVSMAFYLVVSFFNPLNRVNTDFIESMHEQYSMGFWAFVPVLLLFTAAAFRIKVNHAMSISAISGIIIAVFYQGETLRAVIGYIVMGYRLSGEGALQEIMKSGGVVSMINIAFIVLISAAYSGILDKASLMDEAEGKIKTWVEKVGVFPTMLIISVFASIIGCTQTLAIIITFQLMKNQRPYIGDGKEQFALDLENSVVLIAPLIPWNMAGAILAEAIGVGTMYISFAFFLYVLPMYYLLKRRKTYGI